MTNNWQDVHYMGTREDYLARQDEKRRKLVLANRAARTLKKGR